MRHSNGYCPSRPVTSQQESLYHPEAAPSQLKGDASDHVSPSNTTSTDKSSSQNHEQEASRLADEPYIDLFQAEGQDQMVPLNNDPNEWQMLPPNTFEGASVLSLATGQDTAMQYPPDSEPRDDENQNLTSTGEVESKVQYPTSTERKERSAKGWKILQSKRSEAQRIRISTMEMRTEAEGVRQVTQEAEKSFMERVQFLFRAHPTILDSELLLAYQQLQQAQANERAQNGELVTAETNLVTIEGELREVEARMYQEPDNTSVALSDEEFDYIIRERDPTESIASSRSIRRDNSVQARKYLAQRGEANLLRERLMDLDTEFAQVIEEKAVREDIGLELDETSKCFLNDFEAQREALAAQLDGIRQKMAEYRPILEDRDDADDVDDANIFEYPVADEDPLSTSASETHSQFGNDPYFDDGAVEDPYVAAVAQNFLLPDKDPRSVYIGATQDHGELNSSKMNWVNSWLLHRLRKSTHEIGRLGCVHAREKVFLGAEDFASHVLDNWYNDGTIARFYQHKPTPGSQGASMTANSGKSARSRAWTESGLKARRQTHEDNFNPLRRSRSARYTQTEP